MCGPNTDCVGRRNNICQCKPGYRGDPYSAEGCKYCQQEKTDNVVFDKVRHKHGCTGYRLESLLERRGIVQSTGLGYKRPYRYTHVILSLTVEVLKAYFSFY